MYEPPPRDLRSGCRETWLLTRATFAIIIPALAAMIAVLAAIVGTIILFSIHPALALLPVAAVAVAIALYARWERKRFRPPDPW
jgi:hypothetical protein